MRPLAVLVLSLLLGACTEDQVLLVNVLTDFTRGRDFTSVRTELLPVEGAVEREQTRGVDAAAGLSAFRVAELSDVPNGAWMVRATLLDEAGSAVATGRVLVELGGAPQIVTVVITRDCVGVSCDGQAVCVGGECVEPTCSPEQPDACPDECSVDDACAATGPDCFVGRCVSGICFEVADDAVCGGGICEAESGCVGAPVDAGPPDAGPDGGPDAGPPDAGPLPVLTGVVGLALGDRHTCAQLATEIRCWGANDEGQLGNGTLTPTARPGPPVTSGRTGLRSGANHVCTDAVACWGSNTVGQLGRSDPSASPTPLSVNTDDHAIGGPLALGRSHTCAPVNDLCVSPGPCELDMYCWGANDEGQLGDQTRVPSDTPVVVEAAWQVIDAAAGDKHTCAISFEGLGRNDLLCWGANSFGQLGDGTLTRRLEPVPITLPGPPLEVVAGAFHTCVRIAGDVYCFGSNEFGQIDGTPSSRVQTPSQVILPGPAESLAAGGFHTCAVVGGGVYCWGQNEDGQLGDGTTVDRAVPAEVDLFGDEVAAVFAGLAHTCAQMAAGTVYCWGGNIDGQLGNGTDVPSPRPVPVLAPLP